MQSLSSVGLNGRVMFDPKGPEFQITLIVIFEI